MFNHLTTRHRACGKRQNDILTGRVQDRLELRKQIYIYVYSCVTDKQHQIRQTVSQRASASLLYIRLGRHMLRYDAIPFRIGYFRGTR